MWEAALFWMAWVAVAWLILFTAGLIIRHIFFGDDDEPKTRM